MVTDTTFLNGVCHRLPMVSVTISAQKRTGRLFRAGRGTITRIARAFGTNYRKRLFTPVQDPLSVAVPGWQKNPASMRIWTGPAPSPK